MKAYRNRVFPLLELGLYISFLAADIWHLGDSTPLKFVSICLCALTALLGADSRDGRFVAAAQCLTVWADWFLLVRGRDYALGVGFFLLVQLTYLLRMAALRGAFSKGGLALRAVAFLGAVMVLWSGDPLSALALFYFANLLVNLLEAAALGERVFAWGLALFVCCDLCVGLWNVPIRPALTEFARVGMWLFYLPSQVLIVLSAHRKGESP